MAPEKYSAAFLARLAAVKDKRPKTVIDHLLKHGSITTEQLRTIYKYADPRRAIQDVRDQGIPIVRSKVKGADGRSIGAYRLETHRLYGPASWADGGRSLKPSKLRWSRRTGGAAKSVSKSTRSAIFKSITECPTRLRGMSSSMSGTKNLTCWSVARVTELNRGRVSTAAIGRN